MKLSKLKILCITLNILAIISAIRAYDSNQPVSNTAPAKKLKFGAKIPTNSESNEEITADARSSIANANLTAQSRRAQASANSERASAKATRRYKQPPLEQRQNVAAEKQIMQYKIPIVNKDYTAAPAYETQRSAGTTSRNKPTRNNKAPEKIVFATNMPQSSGPTKATHFERDLHGSTDSHNNNNNENAGEQRTKPVSRSKTSNPIMPSAATTRVSQHVEPTQQFPNPFEILTQSVWNLFNPNNQQNGNTTPHTTTTTTSRKPPKKYKPNEVAAIATHQSVKAEKRKMKTTTTTTTTSTTTLKPTINRQYAATANNDGPFRIALPTLFNIEHDKEKRQTAAATAAATSALLRQRFECPRESEVRFQLFPKICKQDDDCAVWERDELCCEIFGAKSCVSGVPKPLEEARHAPILGLIPRKCPTRPLAELWWDVQECHTDMDCWPRVCCPDGRRRYCRTSQPELETVPVQVKRSFNYLSEYLECTAPPPRIFDLHPKACTSTLDCFPNVCCQEAGLRHCRPPKKSLLTLMANFLNVDFVKRLTQNIVIK